MRKSVLLLLLVACNNTTHLRKYCPKNCYTADPITLNIGECHAGKPECDSDMNVIACHGEVTPTEEICDGKDNACIGVIDLVYPFNYYGFRRGMENLQEYPCYHLGACITSRAKCVNGSLVCFYDPGVEIVDGQVAQNETRCDNIDGDCDGQTDENVFTGQYCYEGPIGTEAIAPCHPGSLQCINGQVQCVNQHLPSVEICNGLDDDCDSIIDNTGATLNSNYDIVFIVDTSASMASQINAVATALNAYSAQFDGNTHYRFALVIMSSPTMPLVQIDTNFTDFATIRNRFTLLSDQGSSAEASLDAIYFVCDSANPLSLNWRGGANRAAFMFTDEPPQTYTNPYTTSQMVIDTCLASQTIPIIWALQMSEFDHITQDANGIRFWLSYDWHAMFEDMNSVLIMLCQ